MKNTKKYILRIFAILLFVSASYTVLAQGPPAPPDDKTSGSSGNNLGGNAPIGGGLFVLLGLGAAYGGRKIYQIRKEGLEE